MKETKEKIEAEITKENNKREETKEKTEAKVTKEKKQMGRRLKKNRC